MYFTPAKLETSLYGKQHRLLLIRAARRGNMLSHQPLRIVEQHPIGFAGLFIFHYLAAERAGRVFGYFGDPYCGAVGDGPVSIGSDENYRVIGRYAIQLPSSRENGRLPKCLDPTTACNPVAGFGGVNPSFDLRQEIFEARRPFEIERHLPLADAAEVIVGIGEAGDDRSSAKIDYASACALICLRVFVRAYEKNAAVLHGYSFRVRRSIINGVDVSVNEKCVGRLRSGKGQTQAQTRDDQSQGNRSHLSSVRF